jgi:anti-sigma B factor antagonist
MKPANPTTLPDPAFASAPSATDQRTPKPSKKKFTLSLEAEPSSNAIVLHCKGRITFRSEAQTFSTIVAEVLPTARRMVVDLAGIDFVDSGGLGELMLTHMWAEAAGYALKFASPRKSVLDLFEITNVVSVFDVYASVPEAVEAMYQEQAQPI